jgi:uncharacterized Zn finger protein (UPF0148 family)
MPARLRELRARLMLEECNESLGVPEAPCPACGATGWTNRQALVSCPICAGFQQVPEPLAKWYVDESARRRAHRPAPEESVVPEPVYRARRQRDVNSTRPERLGRWARHGARVHLPD